MSKRIIFAALIVASLATAGVASAQTPTATPTATAPAKPAMKPAAKPAAAAKPSLYWRAQTKLKELGDYNGAVNGKRTKATIASIEKFQKEKTLKVSGRLTPETVKALGV